MDDIFLNTMPDVSCETIYQTPIQASHILINSRDNEKLIKLNIILVIFFYEKRYDDAMNEVTTLVNDPDMAGHRGYLALLQGQISELKGDFEETLNYYSRAFTSGKWSRYLRYYFWNRIGFCWLLKKKFRTSERCSRKAINLNSTSGHAWMNLGASLEFQGKFMEAARCYGKAMLLKIKLKSIVHLHRLIDLHR